ncbi:MAG: transcription termination factor Rho [Pseudomonadota bacterium]
MAKKEKQDKAEHPLDKMTAKELRDLAISTGKVVGAHGMNKEELIGAIREARGEKAPEATKTKTVPVRELKAKVRDLRARKTEIAAAGDHKRVDILRRKMNRLKKKTRG